MQTILISSSYCGVTIAKTNTHPIQSVASWFSTTFYIVLILNSFSKHCQFFTWLTIILSIIVYRSSPSCVIIKCQTWQSRIPSLLKRISDVTTHASKSNEMLSSVLLSYLAHSSIGQFKQCFNGEISVLFQYNYSFMIFL